MPAVAYREIPTLPRLAWLADLKSGLHDVTVYHGPWVETWAGGCVEGAWDGAWRNGRFDTARTFIGSGARVTDEGILFATATHPLDRLYAVRLTDRLLVANSLVHLLVRSEDGVDLDYPNYYFDLLDFDRQGLTNRAKTIRTAQKRRVMLWECGNFLVDSHLNIHRAAKLHFPPPQEYADYRQTLLTTIQALVTNADGPARRQRYRPVAAASRGYDSTAITALAQQVGGTEALTFATIGGQPNADDGTTIAQHLGLKVTQYDRLAYKRLATPAEAEFCVCPTGTAIPIAAAEDQLQAAILLTGRYADLVWEPDEKNMLPDFLWPTAYNRTGSTYEEFRLRVGCLHLPVPAIMAEHNRQLYRINTSAAMQPWSLASNYNKPIPRRIAEEASVPRTLFGVKKMASGHAILFDQHSFHPESWESFAAFWSAHRECGKILAQQRSPVRKALHRGKNLSLKVARQQLPYPLYRRYARTSVLWTRRADSPLWATRFLYSLHWGFAEVRRRYEY